jgi:multiple sugar transport system permease protein
VPVIISLIASASIWNLLYDANDGLINQLLVLLGAQKVNFLGGRDTALPSVAAVAVWKSTGYYMVIYYAGIMNVSQEVKEAAIVDGARPWQRFLYITLPILKPITYMVVTLGIIGSFQVFDLVYKMTGGGPGRATYTVAFMIYSYAFQDKRIGYASALAVMLLCVILLVHLVQTLVFNEKERA